MGTNASTPRPRPREGSTYPHGPGAPPLLMDNATRWAQLESDGYTVIPGVVDPADIDKALRVINRSLGKHTPIRENMCPGCGGMKEITDLLNKSALKGILETLIGPFTGGGGGQIALRFPGDNAGPNFEVYPGWENHWHIDGLSTPDSNLNSIPSGDIHNFTALVGVLLQDVPEENMGNLVLYPGSHFELQEYFKSTGFSGVLTHGTKALPKLNFARAPVQVRGKAGDAIIVNYMTAHLVAPNLSSNIRYCIYFRLKGQCFEHQNRRALMHRPESMLNAWLDWPRLAKTGCERTQAATSTSIDESADDEELQRVLAQSTFEY